MDDFQYLKLISFTLIKIKITDQKSSLSANKVAFYPGTLVRVGSPNIFIIVSLLVIHSIDERWSSHSWMLFDDILLCYACYQLLMIRWQTIKLPR